MRGIYFLKIYKLMREIEEGDEKKNFRDIYFIGNLY